MSEEVRKSFGRKKHRYVLEDELNGIYDCLKPHRRTLKSAEEEIKYLKAVEVKYRQASLERAKLFLAATDLANALKKYDIQDGEATHALAGWRKLLENK